MAKQSPSQVEHFEIVNPAGAGIDIGSRFHMVSPNPETAERFGVFTEDLHALARYLRDKGIKSVAMESTGFYWKNLYVLLQEYGFEVLLVNPGFAKNVRGRKTDRIDAHWLRKMHSCGLLPGSFQPPMCSRIACVL